MADNVTDLDQERRQRRAGRVQALLLQIATQAISNGQDDILEATEDALIEVRRLQMEQGPETSSSQLVQAILMARGLC